MAYKISKSLFPTVFNADPIKDNLIHEASHLKIGGSPMKTKLMVHKVIHETNVIAPNYLVTTRDGQQGYTYKSLQRQEFPH